MARLHMVLFAVASLWPACALVLACLLGGLWPVVALLSISLLILALDLIAPKSAQATTGDGLALTVTLGLIQVPLMGLCVWSLAQPEGTLLSKALIFVAAGLYFGQIGNSSAHELIHRSARWPRRLGLLAYASVLHAHHASAHRLVHHVHVGTPLDPNTPRGRESFWRYAMRAWPGEYRAGRAAETKRYAGRQALHPFALYAGLHLLMLAASLALAGPSGALILVGLALYAQTQLFLCDYVQHWGLSRRLLPDGSFERVGPQHSWNAPHLISNAMMLNAPRHSDHHLRPQRPYPALELDPERMPTLPYSLPTMALIATLPPLWRHIMDPILDAGTALPARDMRSLQRAGLEKLASAGQARPNLAGSPHDAPDLPARPRPDAPEPRSGPDERR